MAKTIITIVRMIQNVAQKKANRIELDKTISSIDSGNQSYMSDNFSIANSNVMSRKYIDNISTTKDAGSQEATFPGENTRGKEICSTRATREVELPTMSDRSMMDLQKGIII